MTTIIASRFSHAINNLRAGCEQVFINPNQIEIGLKSRDFDRLMSEFGVEPARVVQHPVGETRINGVKIKRL